MKPVIIATLAASGLVLSGCASGPKYGHSDRMSYDIGVREQTEILELAIAPTTTQLSINDRTRIKQFVLAYKSGGHGPLVISMPSGGANGQAAVQAAAEARAIAYELGVNYERMAGAGYNATGAANAPLTLAFTSYEAIPPKCPSLSSVDLSDMSTNDPQPAFGCFMQANLAAMIADPADLLGGQPLDPESANNPRRSDVLTKYQAGQPTATERTDAESGAVSSVVQ